MQSAQMRPPVSAEAGETFTWASHFDGLILKRSQCDTLKTFDFIMQEDERYISNMSSGGPENRLARTKQERRPDKPAALPQKR